MISALMRAWAAVGRQLVRMVGINIPYILVQSGVPVGIAPNGTVDANGTITLGTALPRIYSNGIWLRLPAGAVVGGAAGLYWCDMTSTTVGQVYTNFVDTSLGFVPYIPTGTLVNAVGSNAAYTQTTGADIVVAQLTLPANSLGLNGRLRGNVTVDNNNSASIKQIKLFFGNTNLWQMNGTTSLSMNAVTGIANCGVTNQQIGACSKFSGTGLGYVGTVTYTSTQDTTTDQTVKISLQLASAATDYFILDALLFEVLPS